jgi:septation ring formation regulator EzrA
LNRLNLEKEIESLEEQIKALEYLQIKEIEEKKLALLELMDAEKKAKNQMQSELDQYRTSLLQRREKNLKLKTHLSFLKHETALSEPCVFSYMSNIPDHNKK